MHGVLCNHRKRFYIGSQTLLQSGSSPFLEEYDMTCQLNFDLEKGNSFTYTVHEQ